MTLYNFTIKIEYEDGWYSVRCRELPGAISQGKTLDDAMKNIKEAIEGYIEAFPGEFRKVRSKVQVKNKTLEQKTIIEISA
jgi:predicted RNase H-like HicB family nuclease